MWLLLLKCSLSSVRCRTCACRSHVAVLAAHICNASMLRLIFNSKSRARSGSVPYVTNPRLLNNWLSMRKSRMYSRLMTLLLTLYRYVKDILTRTSKSQETVTIEPNGEWHLKNSDDSSQGQTNGNASYRDKYEDDDDDDLVISEVNPVSARRIETPKNATPSISTPITAGRDSSSAGPRGIASTSAKRPMAAIIDLTLSDDDDDDPPPPPKRQNTSTNGYTMSSTSPISSNGVGYL